MALASRFGRGDAAWPSNAQLIEDTGLSARSVRYGLRCLERCGLIEDRGRTGATRQIRVWGIVTQPPQLDLFTGPEDEASKAASGVQPFNRPKAATYDIERLQVYVAKAASHLQPEGKRKIKQTPPHVVRGVRGGPRTACTAPDALKPEEIDSLRVWHCDPRRSLAVRRLTDADLLELVEQCLDWGRGKGARKVSWLATCRNWIRTEADRTYGQKTRPRSNQGGADFRSASARAADRIQGRPTPTTED